MQFLGYCLPFWPEHRHMHMHAQPIRALYRRHVRGQFCIGDAGMPWLAGAARWISW